MRTRVTIICPSCKRAIVPRRNRIPAHYTVPLVRSREAYSCPESGTSLRQALSGEAIARYESGVSA